MSAFDKLFENVATTLKNSADLLTLVPAVNIMPAYDAAEPIAGGLITYAIRSRWDPRYKRGDGTFHINCEHPNSASDASSILDQVRLLLTAPNLSGEGVSVKLFLEQPDGEYAIAPRLNRFTATATFKIMVTQ